MVRTPKVGGWRLLPHRGRTGHAPECPVPLSEDAHARYVALWASPVACTWSEQDAADVASVAMWRTVTSDALRSGDVANVFEFDEAGRLAIEDRLGLSPAARLDHGWIIVSDETFNHAVAALEGVERVASLRDDEICDD